MSYAGHALRRASKVGLEMQFRVNGPQIALRSIKRKQKRLHYCKGLQINEALEIQIEVQRRLHEQLESIYMLEEEKKTHITAASSSLPHVPGPRPRPPRTQEAHAVRAQNERRKTELPACGPHPFATATGGQRVGFKRHVPFAGPSARAIDSAPRPRDDPRRGSSRPRYPGQRLRTLPARSVGGEGRGPAHCVWIRGLSVPQLFDGWTLHPCCRVGLLSIAMIPCGMPECPSLRGLDRSNSVPFVAQNAAASGQAHH
ncbi:hypothetical protein Taro_035071 [Colocasia esculenta]|uniref:MYB-CC type transcription factor LHEQLE-containing domain-containing protein n=1 Tax=Colocasia esculenta TaxID=4460 RepID=A0A843WC35_COLES|nr:hypothetical protein [Colocasia esculenta]